MTTTKKTSVRVKEFHCRTCKVTYFAAQTKINEATFVEGSYGEGLGTDERKGTRMFWCLKCQKWVPVTYKKA